DPTLQPADTTAGQHAREQIRRGKQGNQTRRTLRPAGQVMEKTPRQNEQSADSNPQNRPESACRPRALTRRARYRLFMPADTRFGPVVYCVHTGFAWPSIVSPAHRKTT